MSLRALLVDMDGTLVDTAEANFRAYAEALSEAGVSIARPDFERIATGRNWRQFLPPLLGHDMERAAAVAGRKAALYPRHAGATVLNAGLVVLLRDFAARGGKVALVTTASRPNVDTILHSHGLSGLFDLIVSGNDVQRHKPDPEAYALAAARLGVTAGECLVFEDSEIGIRAARAFGAPVCPVGMSALTQTAPLP